MDIFSKMEKTKRVCECCGSYLYYHAGHDCLYCPECDWDELVNYYHSDNMRYA